MTCYDKAISEGFFEKNINLIFYISICDMMEVSEEGSG